MGQKQNRSKSDNLIIELNRINNSTTELYLYNLKNSRNYKGLISSPIMNEILKIKSKSSLVEYLKENNEISYKGTDSLLFSFNLGQNKYQFELYDIENYKCILNLAITLDYLFLFLIILSLLRLFISSKSYSYFCLRLLHFLLIGVFFSSYASYRYFQIFEFFYDKFDYKDHFYYILLFFIPVILNILCFIGCIFISVNALEKLFLMTCLGLEGGILYNWTQEQFEKNTYKEMEKYFFELKKKISKYIRKEIKEIKN